MMTINNEKVFTEYEISVVQELTTILLPKLKKMGWNDDATEWELHKYIRTEVFDEFYDYLCANMLLDATATSISEADYSGNNTTDLDEIDAFCDKKLKELGYRELPTFKQASYDTLVELGLQGSDLICSGHYGSDEMNKIGLEIEDAWYKLSEEVRDDTGYIEFISMKLDEKRKTLGMPSEREAYAKKNLDQAKFTNDVAYILVQLTEDFSKELYEKYDAECVDTDIRGEFLFEMAQEIAKSKEWRDSEISRGEVIENAIEAKKKELAVKNAKYKVGDVVYIFHDLEIDKANITAVRPDETSKYNEVYYDFQAMDGTHYEDLSDAHFFKDLNAVLTYVQEMVGTQK